MRSAKLFRNGGNQTVRLPKEFRLDGDEVFIKKAGNAVVLLPKKKPWDALVDSLSHFSADFMRWRSQPKKTELRKSSRTKRR